MLIGFCLVQCRHFSNIILSQFLLILGPKSILFSHGCGVAWFCFVLFCFIHDLSGDREEKLFYNINIAPVLRIWDIYVVFVEIGAQ